MESTTFQRQVSCFTGIAFAGFLLCSTCFPLRGDMMLTAAGTSEGLALSTFATGFPVAAGLGPLGIAFLPGGSVVVSDFAGNVRVFTSDVDGQNAAAAPVGQNYGQDNAFGLAQVGGQVYMGQPSINDVAQLNNDGTFNQIITPLRVATGLIADPVTGHLFVSTLSNGDIWNVDPVTKTATLFVNGAGFFNDGITGLAISPDGSTLYGASWGREREQRELPGPYPRMEYDHGSTDIRFGNYSWGGDGRRRNWHWRLRWSAFCHHFRRPTMGNQSNHPGTDLDRNRGLSGNIPHDRPNEWKPFVDADRQHFEADLSCVYRCA